MTEWLSTVELDDVLALVGYVLGAASLVTGWTDTPKDNQWVRRIIGWVSVVTPRNAPGTFKWPWQAL